jgi:hypothetical protein
MLSYHIWHKIKNHPVVFTIPFLGEFINIMCVDIFSTITTFPLMFLKKQTAKKLVFNDVQILELFNISQRTSADHSLFPNRSRHGVCTRDSNGSTKSFEQKSSPTFLLHTLLVP